MTLHPQDAGDELEFTEVNDEDSSDELKLNDIELPEKQVLATKSLSKDTKSEKGVELVIELPRDILTAYILCRLTGVWDKHTYKGKCGIYGALIISYLIQFSIFGSLISEIDYNSLQVPMTGSEWWHNLVALAILFMYLWKDLVAFHSSLWFWIGTVEKVL